VFAIRTLAALTVSAERERRVSAEPSWHRWNVWHASLTRGRPRRGTVTYHEDMTTLTERETLELYEKTGALMRGHFRLTSGLHSDVYLQSALVLQHPEHAARLGEALAAPFVAARAQTVLAPAIGGILVAHEVARALGVRALFTEREEGVMRLRRGFALTAGERCLVVEDVITTGGSTREVVECVRAAGGDVVGVGSLIDRSGGTAAFDVKRAALATLNATTWSPESCPLCKTGSRAVKPGSRV
jgi:orotate phosphoribosyltransferase